MVGRLLRWHRIADLDDVKAARERIWGARAPARAAAGATARVPPPGRPPVPGRTGLGYLTGPRDAAPLVAPPPAVAVHEALTLAKYLSREWVDKGRAHVEGDPRFFAQTAGLHASILCVVHEQPKHADEVFFIEFDDGHIREIYSGPLSEWEKRSKGATFEVHGDYDTFVQIQQGYLTQATALMRGRLRLKGSIFKALKYMRALEAVTDILREIPTEY